MVKWIEAEPITLIWCNVLAENSFLPFLVFGDKCTDFTVLISNRLCLIFLRGKTLYMWFKDSFNVFDSKENDHE